jgi:REP element-mobilizing transposase RayT
VNKAPKWASQRQTDAQSLARIVLHIVFSTKSRLPAFRDTPLASRLHAYIAGILQDCDCEPIRINGVVDHVHILCNLSRTWTVAKLIEEVKKSSSNWLKRQIGGDKDFAWQGGYGAFSVSESNVGQVRDYVARQEEHHRKRSYQDEFRALCAKHGITIDER